MSDDLRKLSALLNGIARKDYYGDSEITTVFLKEQIYSDISDEEFNKLNNQATKIIKSIATSDMDFNQLEAFLTSMMKKKDNSISEDESKVYVKFWKNHKNRIHESLVAKTQWNEKLKSVNWRVDIINKSRNQAPTNDPVTIVELELENKNPRKVIFEMDEGRLEHLLSTLYEIKDVISNYS